MPSLLLRDPPTPNVDILYACPLATCMWRLCFWLRDGGSVVTGQMQSNGLLSRLLVEMTIIASSQFPPSCLSLSGILLGKRALSSLLKGRGPICCSHAWVVQDAVHSSNCISESNYTFLWPFALVGVKFVVEEICSSFSAHSFSIKIRLCWYFWVCWIETWTT